MKRLLGILLAFGLLVTVPVKAQHPTEQRAAVRAFVSVLPLRTFAEAVGGDRIRVEVMVQPGHSPATYEPTPRQVAQLARAQLFVRTGVPFEETWMERIRAANPDILVVDAREGIDLRHEDGHGHDNERDPHVWTSPPLVKRMAARIRDGLISLDAEGASDYHANYAEFAVRLDDL